MTGKDLDSALQRVRDERLFSFSRRVWLKVWTKASAVNCQDCFMFEYCQGRRLDEYSKHLEGICDYIFDQFRKERQAKEVPK